MTTQVTLDLETLASTPDAAVIQIAAVAFDSETGVTVSEFDAHVRYPSGRIDPGTVFWWMQQTAAPSVAKACEAAAYDMTGALLALSAWFATLGPDVGGVWSLPASFDLPILSLAYVNAKADRPWHCRLRALRALRCSRARGSAARIAPTCRNPGGYLEHDALSDCRMQVAWLVAASRKTGVPL